jgi:hypothetical protein
MVSICIPAKQAHNRVFSLQPAKAGSAARITGIAASNLNQDIACPPVQIAIMAQVPIRRLPAVNSAIEKLECSIDLPPQGLFFLGSFFTIERVADSIIDFVQHSERLFQGHLRLLLSGWIEFASHGIVLPRRKALRAMRDMQGK